MAVKFFSYQAVWSRLLRTVHQLPPYEVIVALPGGQAVAGMLSAISGKPIVSPVSSCSVGETLYVKDLLSVQSQSLDAIKSFKDLNLYCVFIQAELKDYVKYYSREILDGELVIFPWSIGQLDDLPIISAYDLDGVLCEETPRMISDWTRWQKTARQLLYVGDQANVISSRIDSLDKESTLQWLERAKIKSQFVELFPGSVSQRTEDSVIQFKAEMIHNRRVEIYVEANDARASRLGHATDALIYCFRSGRVYAKSGKEQSP